ncbi:MAG: deiodinase [Planctomycetes bacterium]|nr:deiodinase [Planctomycetota bacterium]
MYQTYKDDAGFLFVYIHEAHPKDGWQMSSNTENDVVFNRPKSFGERRGIAKKCSARLKLSMPVVVDTMDNRVDIQYAAWPERMFVVDRNGKIIYAGKQGPWGFKPKAAEKALKKLLKRG